MIKDLKKLFLQKNNKMHIWAPFYMVLITVAIVWELVWKGIALWRAGRNNDLTWFIFIFIFNTLGILPIIYIFAVDRPKQKMQQQNF